MSVDHLAHPLTESAGLGVPPLAIGLTAVVAVAAVAMLAPIRPAPGDRDDDGLDDVDRPLRPPQWATRLLILVALLFCVYAARRGNPDGLSNIAPPLVVGVAWPALVIGALLLPRLWAWLDPWDTAARGLEPLAGAGPGASESTSTASDSDVDPVSDVPAERPPDDLRHRPRNVWPAALVAVAVMHFLVVRADSTQPRTIGLALAAYTIVAVALGVAGGRQLLARSEVFGLTARWAGLLRRDLGGTWAVPPGTEVVLGVIAGGLLFDLARRAGAYAEVLDLLGVTPAAAVGERAVVLGFLATCGLAAGVLRFAEVSARRRGAAGAAAIGALPVVLALLVVTKLRRLLVSLQLLPIVAGDPLGRGWDLLGTRGRVLDPNPFGTTAQRWTAIAAVTLAGLAGAAALRRRTGDAPGRDRAAYALFVLVAAAVAGLSTAA